MVHFSECPLWAEWKQTQAMDECLGCVWTCCPVSDHLGFGVMGWCGQLKSTVLTLQLWKLDCINMHHQLTISVNACHQLPSLTTRHLAVTHCMNTRRQLPMVSTPVISYPLYAHMSSVTHGINTCHPLPIVWKHDISYPVYQLVSSVTQCINTCTY